MECAIERQTLIPYNSCNKKAQLVHQLICAYELPKDMLILAVTPLDDQQLRQYHTEDYIQFVHKVSRRLEEIDEASVLEELDMELQTYGLLYDCCPIPKLSSLVAYVAGSTIEAVKAIISRRCHTVLNWFGGWHHGLKDEASGFCYTNDIVFGILHFLAHGYKRILYVDLDLHHGNAVENAFEHTDKVLTFSLHKYDLGFYPGTGGLDDVGNVNTKGIYHSINMPLEDGITDDRYIRIFDSIIHPLTSKYRPQVIMVQCGADGLVGDRIGTFNLTTASYEHCVTTLAKLNVPLILLGGGGYHPTNTARLWTKLTGIVLGRVLSEEIPYHELADQYRPSYELSIEPSIRRDMNDDAIMTQKIHKTLKRIEQLPNCEA